MPFTEKAFTVNISGGVGTASFFLQEKKKEKKNTNKSDGNFMRK